MRCSRAFRTVRIYLPWISSVAAISLWSHCRSNSSKCKNRKHFIFSRRDKPLYPNAYVTRSVHIVQVIMWTPSVLTLAKYTENMISVQITLRIALANAKLVGRNSRKAIFSARITTVANNSIAIYKRAEWFCTMKLRRIYPLAKSEGEMFLAYVNVANVFELLGLWYLFAYPPFDTVRKCTAWSWLRYFRPLRITPAVRQYRRLCFPHNLCYQLLMKLMFDWVGIIMAQFS